MLIQQTSSTPLHLIGVPHPAVSTMGYSNSLYSHNRNFLQTTKRRRRGLGQPLSFIPTILSSGMEWQSAAATIPFATSSTALLALRNPFHTLAAAASASACAAATTAAVMPATTTATMGASAAVATTPLATTLTAATAASTTLSLLKLSIVFIAGGLFFSSAMATCTACYAVGMDNVERFATMAKIVWDNVWITFAMGLRATRATLLGEDGTFLDDYNDTFADNEICRHNQRQHHQSWRWKDAWRVLKIKLQETRQKAVEGVEAIRKEAKMYAAAVGPPGLIPLQYVLDRIMPYSIASGLEEALLSSLTEMEGSLPSIKKLNLSHFSAGKQAPKLESARVYDLGDNAMAFDLDVLWDSELEATIQVYTVGGLARIPVTLKNARFKGTVRVVLTPLTKVAPGFGATLVSFSTMPAIGLDIRVAGGEVTRVLPRLRAELIASIQRSIANSMIWPKRVVVPSLGMSDKPILTQCELKALVKTDPLLQAEEALGARPMLRRKLNQMSDVLYRDNAADDELLKSVVKLPMPTFEKPIHHRQSVSRMAQNGLVWEHVKKTQSTLQEKAEATTKEAKALQNMILEQFHTLDWQAIAQKVTQDWQTALQQATQEVKAKQRRVPTSRLI